MENSFLQNIGNLPGRNVLQLAQITAITSALFTVAVIKSDEAVAAIASSVDNISPVRSKLDGTNANSASGGRVNKIGGHPTNANIFFAASEWGGLFRTTDAGRNWSYVQGHVPQVTWDVKFNPSNSNMLIATSFFDGKTTSLSGINISRDGGATWQVPATARPIVADCAIASDVQEPVAFGIAFDPANNANIYVGTNCGLAISNDNGVTWDFVDPTPGDGGGLNVYDIIVHNGGIIDICGDDGHQRSTNGGANFAAGAVEAGGRCTLAVSPDEQNVIFMSMGNAIFESRNGGGSWPTQFANPAPQGRIPFLKVNDRSGNAFDLWYGDVSLFRAGCTTPANTALNTPRCPASNTWTNTQTGGHNDVGDVAFNPTVTVDSCPILFSNDGGIYFNQNTGAGCQTPNWEQPTTSVTALWLWDMDGNKRTAKGQEGIYMGQQDSGAFGAKDAPANAPDWSSPQCCDIFDVEAENNRVVFTVCCFPAPARATQMFLDDDKMDGAAPQIPNYPAGNLFGFRDLDSLSNYAPNSYALVTSASAFFTTNIGASPINWQTLGVGAPAGICSIYSSRNSANTPVFYARTGNCGVTGNGALWRLVGANSTANWQQIQRNGSSQFGAFGINPKDSNHIIANDMSGATPKMVRSLDGGATWTTLDQLDIMLTGNGDFYAQMVNGARPGDTGYPQASLVAINPDDRDMIVAAGQNSGVFLSLDGGNSWKLITDPRTNNALRPHISRPLFAYFETFHGGHANLYLGARGRGAWRISVNGETSVTLSDFDGDGIDDIAVGSPWGIGLLEKNGSSFNSLALKPNNTVFDGWRLNTKDNRIEAIGDFSGNNRSEMLFASPWGIGVLRLSGSTYRANMLAENGTRFNGWLLNTEDNQFGPVGDFDGDGQDEVLVTSPWGIGIFKLNGSTFNVPVMKPNGTRFGGWLLNTADNRFGPVGDFDNDGKDEILVTSPWGIGILKMSGSTFANPALKPNGSRFNGWLLNTNDNRFGPVGDFDANGIDDIVVRSPWGIGLLNLSGNTFTGLMLKPNGTNFGGWMLDTSSNRDWTTGNFNHATREDLFVSGLSGIAILRFDATNKTFQAAASGNNNVRYGGWLLNTRDNHFIGSHDLTGNNRSDILVSSPWGIGIMSQSGNSFSVPAMSRNGTFLGGWRINTMDNKFW